ncbi:MAG: EAL domain-containing protein [Rheinheimera sp.]|nr:EAL domain-containing protein [Rheinheimera sp.]
MKSLFALPKALLICSAVLVVVVGLCLYLALGGNRQAPQQLPLQVWLLQDSAVQTPQQAQQASPAQWQLLADPANQLGYGLGTLWFRLVLEPRAGYAIALDAPFLDEVDFYLLAPDGQLLRQIQTGDQRPFAQRQVPVSSFVFPIDGVTQPVQLLVRLRNAGLSYLPVRYVEQAPAIQQAARQQMLQSFFLGILAFAALLAILLAVVTRQHSLHLFSGLLLCIAAVQAELNGLPFQWLWPQAPQWNQLVEWGLPLAVICCCGFVSRYFVLPPGGLRRLFQGLIALSVLLLLATLISTLLQSYVWQSQLKQYAVYLMQACVLATLGTGGWMLRSQRHKAVLFLLPMSVLMLSIVLAALRVMGLIAESAFSRSVLELGTTLAAVLMTSSLVLGIYLEKARQAQVQQALLERNEQLSKLQQQELNRSKIAPFYGLGSRLALVELLRYELQQHRSRYRLLLLEFQQYSRIEAVLGRRQSTAIVNAYVDSLLVLCQRHGTAVVSLGVERHQTLFSLATDRFALLVQQSDFVPVLTGIRKLLHQKFTVDGFTPDLKPHYASVTVSSEFGQDAEELIAHAALAITYVQKTAGHLSYQHQLGADSRQRLAMVAGLAHAANAGQFSLLFQPLLQISTQQPCGAEAFIRWQHPQLGPVSPAVFIPLAEEAGLMSTITAWVYKEVRKVQNQLLEQQIQLPISMNLSAQDLENPALINSILQHEQKYASAQRIKFELAESALAPDLPAVQKSLQLLKQAGSTLVMDDFGAGQSMLTKLGNLPVSELKIDMALLTMLDTHREQLLAGAIKLGKALDMTVICEGVEHQHQLDFLILNGIDAVQGYLIARPMPAAELPRWLTKHQTSATTSALSQPA